MLQTIFGFGYYIDKEARDAKQTLPDPFINAILIGKDFRIPKQLDTDGTSVLQVRKCVFQEMGSPGMVEEAFVCKQLDPETVLWYNRDTNDTSYGVIMGYDGTKGHFKSVSGEIAIVKSKEEEEKKNKTEPAIVDLESSEEKHKRPLQAQITPVVPPVRSTRKSGRQTKKIKRYNP